VQGTDLFNLPVCPVSCFEMDRFEINSCPYYDLDEKQMWWK